MSTNHYVDNKRLCAEMIEYVTAYHEAKAKGEEPPRVNNYIGRCIKMMAEKLATSRNFAAYSYREDMVGDAIENCLRYLHNFNPEKTTNPFGYFTQIMYYAFLRRIQKEKKQSYVKYKAMENSMIQASLGDMPSDDQAHFQAFLNSMDYDKLAALSDKFETKQPVKKAPRKKKGVEKFMAEDTDE